MGFFGESRRLDSISRQDARAFKTALAAGELAQRRGEALNLRWHNVDWTNSRLTVVGHEEWDAKDKEARVVPVSPELNALLLDAFSQADEGQLLVIPPNKVIVQNLWRDFGVLCKRAGVPRYSKPLHTLRKSCLTDWASRFPMHVVRAWAGHSNIETTATYYLQVSNSDFQRAAAEQSGTVLPRKLPRNAKNEQFSAENENADGSQPSAPKELNETAGDRIRTDDVQLGKLAFYH